MTPERWSEVKRVFQRVLEVDPSERGAFLDGECAGDAAMREEVESMLAAYEDAGDFMQPPTPAGRPSEAGPAVPVASARFCEQCGARYASTELVCPIDGEVLLDDPVALLGTTLDGLYRVERLLGQGGFGTVYLARHVLLRDEVAVKVLRRELSANPDLLRRFLREGRAARSIRHPNVVAIHDLRTTDDGLAYMVLEYVEGRTLRAELKRAGRFSPAEAIDILEQVASALDAAHARGVVHRDLKPENIMMGEEGGGRVVKVLDLGLAKLREVTGGPSTLTSELTHPGQRMGSPHYMSPEQWGWLPSDGSREVDARSDVYSLGVIAYEMVTGRLPFAGDSLWDLRRAHLESLPAPAHERVRLPPSLGRAIARAMARDRGDRYATAGEFAADLRGAVWVEEFEPPVGAENDLADSAGRTDSAVLTQSLPYAPRVTRVAERASRVVGAVTRPSGARADDPEEQHVGTLLPARGRRAWAVAAGLTIVLGAGLAWYGWAPGEPETRRVTGSEGGEIAVDAAPVKPYAQMTEAERFLFVDDRARQVSRMMAGREYRFPPDVRLNIKQQVDRYAARVGNGVTDRLQGEDMNLVLKRGRHYAPYVNFVFKDLGVPPVVGLYIGMIESEFDPSAVSTMGARGMFQILPRTARQYGGDPDELTEVDKAAPIAARYVKDRMQDFGSDRMAIALSVAAYNRGPGSVQDYMEKVVVIDEDETEQRFWSLVSTTRDGAPGVDEGTRYVIRYFAAAIVGENPEAFGLEMRPLSTYTSLSERE